MSEAAGVQAAPGRRTNGKARARLPEQTRRVKMRRVIEGLRRGLSAGDAAKCAGVARATVYKWREEDPQFAKEWVEAVEEATDVLERVAYERAVEKSDYLVTFLLKARRPDVYQPKHQVEVRGSVDVTHSLTGAAVELLEELRRRVQAVPEPVEIEGEAEEVEGETGGASLEEVRGPLLANVAKEGDEGEDGG